MGCRRLVRGGSALVRISRGPKGHGAWAWTVVVVLLALVAAAGCSGTETASSAAGVSASPSSTPRSGGTYNYPLDYDVSSLLPFRAWELDVSAVVAHEIYEGLVAYESKADGTVVTVPCLAQSWSASADATVWTLRLRRGVRFQAPVDREVTAADVVADYRFAADPRNAAAAAYMYAIIKGTDENGNVRPADAEHFGVEALGRYTVRFTLKQPYGAFPETLGTASAWVWPVDYLRHVGRAGFEQSPVGTGPFELSRRVRGSYIDLVRNPGWWNAPSGQPYLESVHFQVFTSVTSRLLAFQKGLIDYTGVPQGQVAASHSLAQVTSGEWATRNLPTLGRRYVGFNMNGPVVGGERGLPIRQAIAAAVDRRALVAAVYDGVAIPQTGLVPPLLAGWSEGPAAPAYDPAGAARLYKAAGSPTLPFLYLRDNREAVATTEWLRSACAAAGIRLKLRPVSWDEAMELWGTKRMPAMFLSGWLADYPSADNFLYDMYISSQSSGSSGTSYSDKDVDRLLSLARATSDVGRRYDLNRRAAAEIMADLPVVPLIEFADYRLLSTRLAGFSVNPLFGVDMWKLWVK
jgi:oligopeptide transport system substrate-binding protein